MFKNVESEELLILVRNYKKTLDYNGATSAGGHIQHLRTLLQGEALHTFNIIEMENGATNNGHLEEITMGICKYLFSVNAPCKKKRAMNHSMRKMHTLKTRLNT